jgi:L-gulonolactone oxidase
MEFAVPAAAGEACFRQIRTLVQSRFAALEWPVEYRTLADDDVWLSPAYRRPTVTISVHEDAGLAYEDLFGECEAIFRAHDGRPHWGKLHSLGPADLARHYPRWRQFVSVRGAVDPDGVFLNPYLRALLHA